jgi:hypothetical protein
LRSKDQRPDRHKKRKATYLLGGFGWFNAGFRLSPPTFQLPKGVRWRKPEEASASEVACGHLPGRHSSCQIKMTLQRSNNTTCPLTAGVSSLLVALVVFLSLFAANESLHRELHATSSTHHDGTCAICRVAEGQMDVPVSAVPRIFVPVPVSWAVTHPENPPPQFADFSVASSRGPPSFFALL